ncbi:MAG: AAA family ATPase [Planctomycetes bacterium]|nr:AAA family ATPase [Planctomycetota bacterium]
MNIILDNRCENCGYGIKHTDGEGQRKWCFRCMTVYYRKQELKPEQAEKTIIKLVEPKYTFAKLDDLDPGIKEQLINLEQGRDLYIYGPVGVGKTFLMAALLRHFIYEGFECLRINFDDLCVKIRSSFSPASKETEWELIKPYKKVDKLFIDDLGLRSKEESQFAYQTLYSTLNKRQERILPTYICSNKTINQIEQSFDSRIASRLSTALAIELTGKDKRREYQNETIQKNKGVLE